MRSADVYCAPNTGGESFGIVLVEAMAAGTAVVASDLDAFRRVLVDGKAGRLVPVDDAAGLADGLIEVLEDDAARERYIEAAAEAVRRYDWSVVARQIMRVYETVAGAGAKVQVAGSAGRSAATGGSGDHLARDHRAGRVGRRASCWWARGRSRPPTGWTGCTCATTCPGRRSTGRWPGARWWRARSPSTPTAAGPDGKRLAALADAAERAPRTGREAAENELSAALARRRPGVAAGGAGRRAGRRRGAGAAGPPLPQRRGPRHPGAAGTARGAHACASAEPPRCQPISRSPNALRRRRGKSDLVSRRTSARVVLLDEDGAVLLFCGSDPASDGRRRRRGGGSPSAARPSRARRCPRPRCANWRRRPGCGSIRPT